MKTFTWKQAIVIFMSAMAMFALVSWGSYLVRGEYACGGELFVPILTVLLLCEVFGKEKDDE